MPKSTVADWDTTAANNTDVGGINIAEGCAAANINNALREIMAQVATLDPVGASTISGTTALRNSASTTLVLQAKAMSDHTASGDHDARYARLSAAVEFSEVTIDANAPSLFLNEADQAVDSRLFSVGMSAGSMVVTARTDAGAAKATMASIDAAGTTAASAATVITREKGDARFHPLNSVIGVSQTWQNVSASRTFNTSYQNTTGKPIQVQVTVAAGGTGDQFEVSTDNSTWVPVASFNTSSGIMTSSVIVPNNHYYRSSGSLTILYWSELR